MTIASVQEVTPGWLTERLQAASIAATVARFEVTKTHKTNSSLVHHLAVTYSGSDDAPAGLVLKLPYAELLWSQREPQFYREVVPATQARCGEMPFLVRCYSAAHDPETGRAHLLFEDLSATHYSASADSAPTAEHYAQVVDSLARFHACWWEHAALGPRFGQRYTTPTLDESLRLAQDRFPLLVASVGDQLSAAQRRWLEKVVTVWPPLRRERLLHGRGITLVHRDLHPLNFLYPHNNEHTRIVDWDAWRVDTGTDDLAYMMACWWDRTLRDVLERALLKRYHQRLADYGVTGYDWAACEYDYRASIVRCLLFLVAAWSPAVWEQLQRGLLAFEQYGCAAVLE